MFEKIVKLDSKVAGFILLLLFLIFPFQLKEAWLQGLPFSNIPSSIIIIAILPLLLIFHFDFLKNKIFIKLLILGLMFKIIAYLFIAQTGISAKVYFHNLNKNIPQKTYESIWLKNDKSFVIKNALLEKKYLPLEWMNELPSFERENATILLNISTYCSIDKAISLSFNGGEALLEESKIMLQNVATSDVFTIPIVKSHLEAEENKGTYFEAGLYQLKGALYFSGDDYKFDIISLDAKKQLNSAFNQIDFFQENPEKYFISNSLVIPIFSYGCNFIVVILILSWLYFLFRNMRLNLNNIFFIVSSMFLTLYYRNHFINHMNDLANLLLFYFFLLIIFNNRIFKENIRQYTVIGISFLLFIFIYHWYSHIGAYRLYSIGDDWLKYQLFARSIFLYGDWINWGEQNFVYQPLYRFFVGVFHTMFGQSSFAQNMFDLWCVIGSSILIFKIIRYFTHRIELAYVFAVIFLIIFLKPGLSRFIGSGLQEISAACFQMLCLYYLIKYKEVCKRHHNIIWAGLFAFIAIMLRVDHILVILSFSFFLISEKHLNLKKHYKPLIIYLSFILFSLVVLFIKTNQNGNSFISREITYFNSFPDIFILFQPEGEHFLWYKLVIAVTFIFIITSLFLKNKRQNLNLFFLITAILFAIIPYFVDVGGYIRRFSIHVLPLCMIFLAVFINQFFSKMKVANN